MEAFEQAITDVFKGLIARLDPDEKLRITKHE
jgi:hypothetical protein